MNDFQKNKEMIHRMMDTNTSQCFEKENIEILETEKSFNVVSNE